MRLSNTQATYGFVTKIFHWLTALLILTAIPLGLVGSELPQDTSAQVARKAMVFSLHKTLGVTIFFVSLMRILWAVTQTKPAPVHQEQRGAALLAQGVHWSLYGALIVVPLSGWIGHAAAEGFAPILWPFGQSLPLVPKSTGVEAIAFTTHWVFTKVLIASLVLHVAGAAKHAFVDRDGTLSRMWFGPAPAIRAHSGERLGAAFLLAAAVYLAGGATVVAITAEEPATQSSGRDAGAGNWQVETGEIAIEVRQMGTAIEGSFANWTADITFDETLRDGRHGTVTVTIDIPSLTLGSVTEQAMGPRYFDAENNPEAVFEAEIVPADDGYIAEGTLSLAGETAEIDLPFALDIDGDAAEMTGRTIIDRRSFGIGEGQTDPGTLGFDVGVDIALRARRFTDG